MPLHDRLKPYRRLFVASCLACPLLMPNLALSQTVADASLTAYLKQHMSSLNSFNDRFDAEVWLKFMVKPISRFIDDQHMQLSLLKLVHNEAKRNGLQPEVVLAVIEIESSFNRFAISRVGAQGLMQVMPFWKNEIGRPSDNLTDTETNLRYGCAILKYYLDKENGRLSPALARYNGSYGKTWYPEKVLDAWDKHWRAGALNSL